MSNLFRRSDSRAREKNSLLSERLEQATLWVPGDVVFVERFPSNWPFFNETVAYQELICVFYQWAPAITITKTEMRTLRSMSKTNTLNLNNTFQVVHLFPGGYSIYPWVGRCGAAPHTLTLFKTNIADFPTLFKTEFRFLIPCLRHLSCLRQKLINRYPD